MNCGIYLSKLLLVVLSKYTFLKKTFRLSLLSGNRLAKDLECGCIN